VDQTGRRFQWLCTYDPAEPLLTPYGCISLIIIEPPALARLALDVVSVTL